ncbi:TadE/TadG family type IV pilus assembly protein [Branchiibius cervicis]|uniref:TadE/TadG family type IV pilus assembly protein n=1 Tax=Branchiibius cervicis TaxID=908252 RepID=A0ABW2AVF5_9MICO
MSGHRRRERGTAALEVASLIPLLLFAALVTLQLGIAGWTTLAANSAARDAARAATLGQDPVRAARNALPGALSAESVSGGPVDRAQRYTVKVKLPSLIMINLGSVSRTVEMPDIR